MARFGTRRRNRYDKHVDTRAEYYCWLTQQARCAELVIRHCEENGITLTVQIDGSVAAFPCDPRLRAIIDQHEAHIAWRLEAGPPPVPMVPALAKYAKRLERI